MLSPEEIYNRVDVSMVKCKGMCEFKVILDGDVVFKDVVYAKMEDNTVSVRDVLGESRDFKNCKIVEVNVNSTSLVLSSV